MLWRSGARQRGRVGAAEGGPTRAATTTPAQFSMQGLPRMCRRRRHGGCGVARRGVGCGGGGGGVGEGMAAGMVRTSTPPALVQRASGPLPPPPPLGGDDTAGCVAERGAAAGAGAGEWGAGGGEVDTPSHSAFFPLCFCPPGLLFVLCSPVSLSRRVRLHGSVGTAWDHHGREMVVRVRHDERAAAGRSIFLFM